MEDQRRSERKSTIDKSNRLREIELKKTAKLKKNKADIQQIEVETSLTINKVEPEEERGIDTDQPGTSGGGIVGYNSSDDVSDVEEYLDPLGAVRSPEKSDSVRRESLVVTLERRSSQADNWSVKVNKFFPSGCVLSPPPCIPPSSPRFHGFLNQTIEGEEQFIEVWMVSILIPLQESTSLYLLSRVSDPLLFPSTSTSITSFYLTEELRLSTGCHSSMLMSSKAVFL